MSFMSMKLRVRERIENEVEKKRPELHREGPVVMHSEQTAEQTVEAPLLGLLVTEPWHQDTWSLPQALQSIFLLFSH